ncbi:type II CAAX prenyl endopeptidase Rce1 family protein [Kribbella sp. NPDC004536]|uniref:CPBP family glutamic-type intramembrane protease n=1 Tax=Kribbella sp. NPDC004536 TaxID=3364106 RepID=UPI0036C939F7
MPRVWLRAAFGAVAMGVALGCAGAVSDLVGNRYVPAAVCALVAVLLIRPYRRRTELGLVDALRGFVTGVVVTGGSAVLVLGAGTLAGWISWGRLHLGDLLVFLITNAVIATLLEAFPEEISLRGHTWTALRSRYRGAIAAIGTTLLFLVVPGLSSLVQLILRPSSTELSLVPAGQDPVTYPILLTLFGFTLIAARQATGSLWTSIGTHLTFLTVNRLTIDGATRDTGWSADLASPDVLLLIPGYLLLAAIAYRILGTARYRARLSGSRRSMA